MSTNEFFQFASAKQGRVLGGASANDPDNPDKKKWEKKSDDNSNPKQKCETLWNWGLLIYYKETRPVLWFTIRDIGTGEEEENIKIDKEVFNKLQKELKLREIVPGRMYPQNSYSEVVFALLKHNVAVPKFFLHHYSDEEVM